MLAAGAGACTPSAAAPEQTYQQEQAEIRASFHSHLDDDSEEEPGDAFSSSLLQRRQKSAHQQVAAGSSGPASNSVAKAANIWSIMGRRSWMGLVTTF